jgi:glycolate dehydrogenase FAD-binding subunit
MVDASTLALGAGDLAKRLAARGIATQPAAFTPSQRDDLGAVAPAREVAPATADLLRDVVLEAGVNESPLLVVGGGTALGCGDPLQRADLAVSMRGLDRVVEHAVSDFVVTVEAGCRLAELQRRIAAERQWLAIEPADHEQATIGGLIATAATSFVAAGHGTLRNHLLGLRVLHADGRFAKAGGRVVKNVAGFDLMKMHHGALGTLGIVVAATLRLRPLPATDLAAWTTTSEAAATVAAAEALAQPGLLPAGAHFVGALRDGGLEGEIVVRFQGARAATLEQAALLETRMSGRTPAWRRDVVEAGAPRPPPLRALAEVATRGPEAGVGHLSLHFMPSRLADLLAALARFGAGRVALDLVRGTGFLKLVTAGAGASLAESLARGVRDLARALEPIGAAAYVQAGPATLRAVLPAHATNGGRARLAAALRTELDPHAILSRGRFA